MQPELFKEGSLVERAQELWTASEQYIRGEIEVEALERIEHHYAEKLKSAALASTKRTCTHGSRWHFLILLSIALVLIAVGLTTFLITKNRWMLIPPTISTYLISLGIRYLK